MDVNRIIMKRVWAMPNKGTHLVAPIFDFICKYLQNSKLSVDPFARDCDIADITNDLNPNTKADHHLDSVSFLKELRDEGVKPDLVIFDPPYSPEQMKREYDSCGLTPNSTRPGRWTEEKNIISEILSDNGTVLSFGWDSCGMGKKRGFQIKEVILVCHGAGHHDTICVADERQMPLFK